MRDGPESWRRLFRASHDVSGREKVAGNIPSVLGLWGWDRGFQGSLRSSARSRRWKAYAVFYDLYGAECSFDKFASAMNEMRDRDGDEECRMKESLNQ